jgi:hypothetical protein
MPLIMAVEASESGFREKCEKPRSHHLRQARFQGRKSDRPPHVYYIKSAGSRYADANQRSDGKRLGSFPKKQILTREQARFIIWCLTYDRIQQKAEGSRYHTSGLVARLAKTFGVSRECVRQIDKRRTWRSINRPKPKQLFLDRGNR